MQPNLVIQIIRADLTEERWLGKLSSVWQIVDSTGVLFCLGPTCPPLRRATELEMKQDGQMEMCEEGTAGTQP